MNNPYAKKLEKVEAKLARLKAHQESLTLPGTFVTGRSGVKPSYRRKLDRQLERTIDLAKAIIKIQDQVRHLRVQANLYDRRHDNSQPVVSNQTPKKSRKLSEKRQITAKVLQDMDFYGQGVLPTGHKLGYCVSWDSVKNEPTGTVHVVYPDGREIEHRAVSIQGVDLEAKAIEIINVLMGWPHQPRKREFSPEDIYVVPSGMGGTFRVVIIDRDDDGRALVNCIGDGWERYQFRVPIDELKKEQHNG